MTEGAIYILSNFKVKEFVGDETYRPVRNKKHIFFTPNTELKKYLGDGLTIEEFAFDLFYMGEIEKLADDNRFLIGKFNYLPKFLIFVIITILTQNYDRYCWENGKSSTTN